MDRGSLLGAIVWTIRDCKRDTISTVEGSLIKRILAVAHMTAQGNAQGLQQNLRVIGQLWAEGPCVLALFTFFNFKMHGTQL